MRKTLFLAVICLLAAVSAPGEASGQVPGFTAAEVQTLGDLNFTARAQLGHTGPMKDRLYAMALALKNGSILSWKAADPDPGIPLGYMATTNFGGVLGSDPYNRGLIDRLAAYLQVPVKAVIWTPVVVPPAPPPVIVAPPAPAVPGDIETAIRSAIRSELAGLQAQVAGLATRLAALEAGGSGSGSGLAGITAPTAGTLEMRSTPGTNQFGISEGFYAVCNVNAWDAAYRCHQNWAYRGTRKLPVAVDGFDSRGSWSYNWSPAAEPLNGVQESPDMGAFDAPAGSALWKAYRGQTLVIDAGAQAAYDYTTGAQLYNSRNVLIAAQRAGWSMYFAVSPERTTSDTPTNRAVMKLEASPAWNPNPVHVVIDGTLRRLKSCNVGGVTVVCF